jgi:aspartyl-tRNA(Asn)/glutamyl-tRNA(Gln) amidotransferase subunit A
MREADVLFLSVTELAAKMKSRSLSPVEVAEFYLERGESLGPRYNAYATLTADRARSAARKAESEIAQGHYRGPLHGIPYAAKDLLAVRGYPTTWGAAPFANQQFDYDAAVIEKLDHAGAVLIGKSAMIELAGGMGYRFASASLTGPAKNPWNTNCWTCGSSSGSGAIVAAGLAPFAIGTETWGSILCPASFCGVTGLRPTFGRVSRWGAMAVAYSMDKIGPLARTAEDAALVLEAIAGPDPRDRSSLPPGQAEFDAAAGAPAKPLKIGRLTNAWQKPAPEIAAAFDAALHVLDRQGCHVEDVELPQGPWEDAGGVMIAAECASAFEDLIESGDVAKLTDPLGQINGYAYKQISASDYLQALRVREILQEKIDTLFDKFDVVAAAGQPVTATTLDANLETDLSFADPLGGIGNLCGLPAIGVPCGISSAGMPMGIQFLARVRNDAAVVAAARLFQRHTDWHTRRPPISQ